MKRLVGLRPSGRLHLGHYFSVIKPAKQFGCDILVADLHSPSVSTEELDILFQQLNQFGLCDQTIQQSSQFIYDERGIEFFRLLELAKFGELKRMTQFNEKKSSTAHLLIYPVLMAYDIMGYQEVIVGEDQKQHLNYARDLLERYQKQYGVRLQIPIGTYVGGRIKNLVNPKKKMSKSEPYGCLFLDDSPRLILEKIKRATTTPEGRKNLEFLYREFVGKTIPKLNIDLKIQLAEGITNRLLTEKTKL